MPELSPRLDFEVFRRDRMVAALPIGHPLLDRRVLRLMDLATEPFIFLTRAGTPVYYDWLMHLCHDAGFHPNVLQEVESGQTAVELVAAGEKTRPWIYRRAVLLNTIVRAFCRGC